MVQQQPEAPHPVLRAVAGSGNEPEAETETGSGAVVPMRRAERAGTALRLRYRSAVASARELELSAERFLYAFTHPQPETMKEHRAYIKSRAWVPEGMPEGAEKAVIAAGVFHHVVIGRSLKALAKSLKFAAAKADEAGDRAPRFYGWVAFLGLLVLILFLAHIL